MVDLLHLSQHSLSVYRYTLLMINHFIDFIFFSFVLMMFLVEDECLFACSVTPAVIVLQV